MRTFPVVVLAFALAGCTRSEKTEPPKAVEIPSGAAPAALASTVHTRDPKSATQLVSGFYDVEENAWRWTAKKFAVALHPPAGSAQNGALLEMVLTVPPPVTEKLGNITLTPSIGGTTLPPATYNKPGQYVLRDEVAPALLKTDPVEVDFQLDKAIPPGDKDLRELGVVVTSVGLRSK
jgi:hypothetical protein